MRTTNNNDEESARTIAVPYWELFRRATKDHKTQHLPSAENERASNEQLSLVLPESHFMQMLSFSTATYLHLMYCAGALDIFLSTQKKLQVLVTAQSLWTFPSI